MAPLANPLIAQAQQQDMPPPGLATPIQMPDEGMPQVFAPTPSPRITTPPTPAQQQIANDQARLEKIHWQQENPWGTANNHPGVGGKIAHVLSVAGNIAGDIFAPNQMAMIPGTELNRQVQEGGLTNRLNREIQEESGEQAQGATTAKTREDTAEAPEKAQSEEELQHAQASAVPSEIAEREANAEGQTPDIATFRAMRKMGFPVQEILQEIEKDKALGLKPAGMEHLAFQDAKGAQFEGNYNPQTGQITKLDGTVVPDAKPIPPPAALGAVTMIAPDPNTPGGGIVQRLNPGAKVAPGSQTTAGVNSMNTPTTNQRTAAGRADTVLSMVPEVLGRIDSVAPKIGPMEGRWNDFMQGKVGQDDPDFAALRSDLLMMSSAVALAHAQGRLPENLREEFDRAINAPKQTPANLKATINTMVPWLQKVKDQGGRPGAESVPESGGGGFRVKLSDAMGLPQNKGKSEQQVEADVKAYGGQVVR